MTTALGVLIGVFMLTSLVFALLWRVAAGAAAAATKAELSANTTANASAKALEIEQLARAADVRRLAAANQNLKAELTKLEKDLDACRDPAVVRARLRELLAQAGSPAGGGYGAVPYGDTTKF